MLGELEYTLGYEEDEWLGEALSTHLPPSVLEHSARSRDMPQGSFGTRTIVAPSRFRFTYTFTVEV